MPFNPEKQTRQANGRFGGKTLAAEVADVGEAALDLGREAIQVVDASFKTFNNKPGEIVVVPVENYGLTYGQILALAVAALAAIYVLSNLIF